MTHDSVPAYGRWVLVLACVRRAQYDGFVLIMSGFLLLWRTLLTLEMFPILVWMYVRLSIIEERESERAFGPIWRDYATRTPRFFPHFGSAERAHRGDLQPTAKP